MWRARFGRGFWTCRKTDYKMNEYPFHVSFLYRLSPSFPSSPFSSSTFGSLISIQCNLSFLVHLHLHTSLSFQPLSFHRSPFNHSPSIALLSTTVLPSLPFQPLSFHRSPFNHCPSIALLSTTLLPSLPFQPLSFHCSSFNTILHSRLSFF